MLCHAMGTDRACVRPAGQKSKASSVPQASHVGTCQGPQPTQVEKDVVSEGWAAVGGHASVIQQLKEMVLLPLQYPEVFKHMGITPPRCGNQQHCTAIEKLKGSLQAHVGPHAGVGVDLGESCGSLCVMIDSVDWQGKHRAGTNIVLRPMSYIGGLPHMQGHSVSRGSRKWQDSGGQGPGRRLQAQQQHTSHAVRPQGG